MLKYLKAIISLRAPRYSLKTQKRFKRFSSHTLTCIATLINRYASMPHPLTMDVWIMLLGLLSSYCLILKNFSGNLSPFLNLVSIPLKDKLCRFVRSIEILENLGML